MKKTFKGKAIYNPSGKAGEYSYWACNLFNGCSAKCEYCYNRHGITAKILGSDKPTLKKCLKDEETALEIFIREIVLNSATLREHGLFFNFVSDPFLPETKTLNWKAMMYCLYMGIPVKALTKQTWWVEGFLDSFELWLDEHPNRPDCKKLLGFGFTLTGHDEMEPGAAPNADRIRAIKLLSDEGYKTWASIEPIIDINSSLDMIGQACNHVDLIKVGLQSGKKYDTENLKSFACHIWDLADEYGFKVYLKDSFVKAIGFERERLPDTFSVGRDFKLHKL